MKKFDTKRLALGIITGLLELLGLLETLYIHQKSDNFAMIWMYVCLAGIMYNNVRWSMVFLEKNPDRHWRQVPRFIKEEPVLNSIAFNFYKWLGLVILSVILTITRS